MSTRTTFTIPYLGINTDSASPLVIIHTCIIRRHHMHGNPMRMSIFSGITRASLNKMKVRCARKDEYLYNSYVRSNYSLFRNEMKIKLLQHPFKAHNAKHVLGVVLTARLCGGTMSPSPLYDKSRDSAPWGGLPPNLP